MVPYDNCLNRASIEFLLLHVNNRPASPSPIIHRFAKNYLFLSGYSSNEISHDLKENHWLEKFKKQIGSKKVQVFYTGCSSDQTSKYDKLIHQAHSSDETNSIETIQAFLSKLFEL